MGGDTAVMRGDIELMGGIPSSPLPTRENPEFLPRSEHLQNYKVATLHKKGLNVSKLMFLRSSPVTYFSKQSIFCNSVFLLQHGFLLQHFYPPPPTPPKKCGREQYKISITIKVYITIAPPLPEKNT